MALIEAKTLSDILMLMENRRAFGTGTAKQILVLAYVLESRAPLLHRFTTLVERVWFGCYKYVVQFENRSIAFPNGRSIASTSSVL